MELDDCSVQLNRVVRVVAENIAKWPLFARRQSKCRHECQRYQNANAGRRAPDHAGWPPCGLPVTECRQISCAPPGRLETSLHHSPCRPATSWPWEVRGASSRLLCNRSSAPRSKAGSVAARDRRKQHAAWSSTRLWCVRYVGEHPLF